MSGLVLAGVAMVDVTPPLGLAMAGFAARTRPADAVHDPLTARALVVEDTAIVVADVVAVDEAFCERVRARCPVPADRVVVAVLHNHGGPCVTPGRLGGVVDPTYLRALEDGCVRAVAQAWATRMPCRLNLAEGADPRIAKNRRHEGGPVDAHLPVLTLEAVDGRTVAVLLAYACHPVVIGPHNTAWTADYPHFVRARIEAVLPGAVCLFLTGCAGDANNGHTAAASFTTAVDERRTFPAAERVGRAIAEAALAASPVAATGRVAATSLNMALDLAPLDPRPPHEQGRAWQAEMAAADAGKRALLEAWIHWSETAALAPLTPYPARVTVLRWGAATIVALPGEPFAATAQRIRAQLGERTIVVGYANGCPGYFPPAEEYASGGYEVLEAHRYYGLPAPFAEGSAERLVEAAHVADGLLAREA